MLFSRSGESSLVKYPVLLGLLLMLGACGNPDEAQVGAERVAAQASDSRDALAYFGKPVVGKVARAGLYRLVRSSGVVDDPHTGTGKAVSKPVVQLVRPTRRIPLIKGAQMYLQYRIWPVPDHPAYADLRRVIRHPKMKLPDGRVSTGADYRIKGRVSANQVIAYTGYGLDEDYELVEGEWTFEIWYQDRKVIEQKFTTYWPDEAEVAAIEPVLRLGNRVLAKMRAGRGSNPRLNWPRVVIETDDGSDEPLSDTATALLEVKRSLDDPLNQP